MPQTEHPPTHTRAVIFDACQVGVVLRTVLFVQAVLAVSVMFFENGLMAWLARLALITGGALPGTLVWLIVACSLKHRLERLPRATQYTAGIVLGMLAGIYACTMLLLSAAIDTAPWMASAWAGGLLAAAQVAALEWRAKGRTPAATTARLAELQSRIRPHFLFNTLNSAIALVRREPARAEGLLEDLSDLFRAALAEHGESITLAQEIELARHYLCIEQVRFGERLRVHWNLDPAADAAKLPPLLLQPLVENAVLHGVEPSLTGADIHITTRRHAGRVSIEISNTVQQATIPQDGTSKSRASTHQGHGMALNNVRDRLRLLHDLESRFQAGLRRGMYVVQIDIPG